MKKKDIILIVVVSLIVIGGILLGSKKNTVNEDQLSNWKTLLENTELKAGINDMSYEYYQALVNVKEGKSIVYIGSSTCRWCQKFNPVLEEIASEHGTKIIYINVANLTQVEYNNLKKTTDNHFTGSTPTTVIFENGKVIDTLGGYVEKEDAISFFEKNGVLK